MATDRDILKQHETGTAQSLGLSDPVGAVRAKHRQVFQAFLTDVNMADGAADADGTCTNGGVTMPMAGKVVAASATAPIAVTAHGTNYATFILESGTVASPTTIASFATDTVSTDDMVAGVAKDMTITASSSEFAAGTVLRCRLAKASAGVKVTPDDATTVHGNMAVITYVVEWI